MSSTNIILITIDCLRADILGCYGGPAHTPSLDSLAKQGIRYQHAYAHSHMTKTTFPSIFGGSYPSQFGGTEKLHLSRFSLVEGLLAQGYHTMGVNSNPWLSEQFGFHRGYADYRDLSSAKPVAHSLPVRLLNNGLGLIGGGLIYPPYPSASEVTAVTLELLQNTKRPFFLWLHYMDAHWPYDLPHPRLYGPWHKEYWVYNSRLARRSRNRPDQVSHREKEGLRQLYLQGVATVDKHVGQVLSALDETDTVMVTADHGEAFGEHGRYFHQLALHSENVRVPLLWRQQGITAGQVEPSVVRHIDIAPTLLSVANASLPVGVVGTNLLPSAQGKQPLPSLPAISESRAGDEYSLSLRQDGWTTILHLSADLTVQKEALYNHHEDPDETENLAFKHPEKIAESRQLLLTYAQNASDFAGEPLALPEGADAEMVARLKALGYID